MKFQVQVTEILQKVIEVEADDEKAAERAAEEQYWQCDIVLMSEDFMNVEFEVTG